MLRLLGQEARHCDGLDRREVMRIGGLALGSLSLPALLRQRAHAGGQSRARARSVIVLFNSGGVPHHETWDPKPEAPEEVRGPFGVIPTRTPGLLVGALMPRTAQLTGRIAVIRTMVTGDNAHSTSGYQMLTGVPHVPLGRENATPGRPNDWPSYSSLVRSLRPARHGLPSAIELPRRLANFDGLYPWPGTSAGILGSAFDPWLLVCDPSSPSFTAPGCQLDEGMTVGRFEQRRALLERIDRQQPDRPVPGGHERYQQQAFDLVAGSKARLAFDLEREPSRVRDRYGRTKYGQCVLLARRLVEAGVSLVQVNWISEDKKRPNGGGWDTHEKHNESLKGWLMPSMDQTYSALIEDLEQRGLLEETLVCWVAEFGHTPKFNRRAGRDHWGHVFSIALAGGGIRGGVVHGSTDRQAGQPLTDPVRPCDFHATLFHCLGYEPDTIVHDIEGRPLPLTRGRVIEQVLA